MISTNFPKTYRFVNFRNREAKMKIGDRVWINIESGNLPWRKGTVIRMFFNIIIVKTIHGTREVHKSKTVPARWAI